MSGFPRIMKPKAIRIGEIVSRTEYSAQLIARAQKLEAGINMAGVTGFVLGLLFAVLLVLIPLLWMG
ncbi:MAG: tetrahydromethanopterin S-methyltransferase subunit F [Archaeoglobales archaeon]|jgi:tetrahydromethanopterin S-methyltransferase F subunit|nr:tetrahydromethanopterin S-methyltransferase subunit F [Archaeoglobales archaeon]TDA27163.1 MAG: tetrahydromethanopterin S-methyltransferase subunit F [Archaeoglobi archaeon]TDA30830.1 MAG: tetrahydromethanopterin S-methyltransferase subunit F [Archaeoglobi archaeon]